MGRYLFDDWGYSIFRLHRKNIWDDEPSVHVFLTIPIPHKYISNIFNLISLHYNCRNMIANTANLVLLWQNDPMIDVESEFLPRHFLWTIIQFYTACMSSLVLQSDITRQGYQPGDAHPHLSWHLVRYVIQSV